MAAGLLIFPGAHPSFGLDGERVTAELRFFLNETTTPATVYTNDALTVPHTFPVESDATGAFPLIWADNSLFFTATWETADGQTAAIDGMAATLAANQEILEQTQALLDDANEIYDGIAAIDAAVVAAAGSASAASGSAAAASAAATAASGFATAASGSSTAASGFAATATTQAGISTAGAQESKSYTGAVTFLFSSTTADADPGAGNVRLNNATPASVTFVYFDNSESGGAAVTAWLDSMDDSSNATKGQLYVRQGSNGAFAIYTVTGAVIDGTGYRKVPVSYLSGGGAFTNGATIGATFARAGDIAGNASIGYSAKTANYTVVAADLGKVIDCTANSFTLTYTAAGTLGAGFFNYIRNSGSGVITGPTADGAVLTLAPGDEVMINCDGTNFHVQWIRKAGYTLLGTTTISGSPSTVTITSISPAYSDIALDLDAVAVSTSNIPTFAVSPDGVSFSSAVALMTVATSVSGEVRVNGYRRSIGSVAFTLAAGAGASPDLRTAAPFSGTTFASMAFAVTGGISAVRFATASGTFSGGTIRLYGR